LVLSGFANTDLDLQLKKHDIHRLIVIGLIAHTCIEATVRYAAELGYDVTVGQGRDGGTRMKRCTPLSTSISRTTASAVVTTNDIVDLIASVQTLGSRAP
jgi:ureidoacrylate peracid hydrolase